MTRDDTLLILIDLQVGALSTVGSMDGQELGHNALTLARAATLLHLPTILVRAEIPGEAGGFLPGLTKSLPQAVTVGHTMNNAWEALTAAVVQADCKCLVMAGIASDVGLCLPAVSAAQAGYDVYALVDVSGTLNARIEQAAWLRMMQSGVSLTSWTAFIAEIQGDYSLPPGPQLRALIGQSLASNEGPFASSGE